MKNKIRLIEAMRSIAIIAIIAVIGFSLAACGGEDDGNDNGNNNGGTFTLTDIPAEYNNKYAYFDGFFVKGAQSINGSTQTITLSQISNGSVSMPTWKDGNRYSGNDTEEDSKVYIFDTAQILFSTNVNTAISTRYFFKPKNSVQIIFSNGSATKSWNDGTASSY